MDLIKRDFYLNQLINKQQNNLIKIITGVRRCGKSGRQSLLYPVCFFNGFGRKELQEKKSLKNIDDSFKKIIIVKAPVVPAYDENGFLVIGLLDFLLLNSKHF